MNAAAIICVIAGSAAAVGGVLLHMGISIGHVSERLPGVDRLVQHISYFGPALVISWIALAFAKARRPLALYLLLCTLVYLFGFLAIA